MLVMRQSFIGLFSSPIETTSYNEWILRESPAEISTCVRSAPMSQTFDVRFCSIRNGGTFREPKTIQYSDFDQVQNCLR